MRLFFILLVFFAYHRCLGQIEKNHNTPVMLYSDSARTGTPFAKDPHVIFFNDQYLMYYSVQGYTDSDNVNHGWSIGIAKSSDLQNWERIGEINLDPDAVYEKKGIAAPCALVIDDKVHLFYQTYGLEKSDAICHAWSTDGLLFTRNKTNPVFHPDGDWNCGRAIDAEVVFFDNKYFMYYATRDPDFKIQMQGVAVAPGSTNFERQDWTHLSTERSILKPELSWELDCVEAASVIKRNNKLYMFYAGGYNNDPQQVGVATSTDGVYWDRLFTEPFLVNGKSGDWNSSESGHPHIFDDPSGRTYLFYQGNNDNGKTWYISNIEVFWNNKGPYLKSEQ